VKFVVHRDIKAENVLMDRNAHIRLVDFGLSKAFSKVNPFLQTPCGSPAYAAPEIVRHETYTAAADIWSAGIFLYAMRAGIFPFYNENTGIMLNDILISPPPMCPTMSQDLRDLIAMCLVKDPAGRATLKQIKDSKWLAEVQHPQLRKEDEAAIASLRVSDVDPDLMEEMRQLEFDVSKLKDVLRDGVMNEVTASYKVMRRERMIDQIDMWQIRRAQKIEQLKSEQRIKLAESAKLAKSTEAYLIRPVVGRKTAASKKAEPVPMARLPFGRGGGLVGHAKRRPSPLPVMGVRPPSPLRGRFWNAPVST
jgi:serine/threonine protein kinase